MGLESGIGTKTAGSVPQSYRQMIATRPGELPAAALATFSRL
ncbi:MAG: hypothetical protein WCO56_22070 [Verrucomicrobiota bacterium]